MILRGKRIISKGLHVGLACTENAKEHVPKPFTSDIRFLFFSDGFDLGYDRTNNFDHYFETLGKVGPVNLSNLIKEHNGYNHKKLSWTISNPFVAWAANVAVEHKVPCALLWIQPCSLFAIYYGFLNKLKPFPFRESLLKRRVARLTGVVHGRFAFIYSSFRSF